MAHCTKCQTEWTFKDKQRTVKNLDGSAKCPYCGEKQYISLKTKRQGSMLSIIIILAIFIPVFFDIRRFQNGNPRHWAAFAPETISVSSWVIAACLARL